MNSAACVSGRSQSLAAASLLRVLYRFLPSNTNRVGFPSLKGAAGHIWTLSDFWGFSTFKTQKTVRSFRVTQKVPGLDSADRPFARTGFARCLIGQKCFHSNEEHVMVGNVRLKTFSPQKSRKK